MTQTIDAIPPEAALLRLATGSWISQALSVVAELNIADQLQDGPKSLDAMARAVGAHAGALYRVMRALAGVGVFARDEDDRFRLTPIGEHLRSDAPNSLRSYLIMLGGREVWNSWGEALHSVRTGEPAFDCACGAPIFDYLKTHPDTSRIFDAAMTSRSGHENQAILAAYDFPPAVTTVDVAGGHGALLTAILRKYPDMRGVLFDRPHVVAGAQATFEQAGVESRCAFTSGDFFDEVPAGMDIYLLKRVIHDWDDERAQRILANCRKAIAPNGRLLLLELVIPPGDAPSPAKLLDLNMLILTGGRERTASEYGALLASAGLQLQRVITTSSAICIVEARPA